MRHVRTLAALTALAMIGEQSCPNPRPRPEPPREPPQKSTRDVERIAAAEAKRQRRAAKRRTA